FGLGLRSVPACNVMTRCHKARYNQLPHSAEADKSKVHDKFYFVLELLCSFFERVDQISCLVFARIDHDLACPILELIKAVTADSLELDTDDARGGPFAILAECDRSDHGVECGFPKICGNCFVVDGFGCRHGGGKDLPSSI